LKLTKLCVLFLMLLSFRPWYTSQHEETAFRVASELLGSMDQGSGANAVGQSRRLGMQHGSEHGPALVPKHERSVEGSVAAAIQTGDGFGVAHCVAVRDRRELLSGTGSMRSRRKGQDHEEPAETRSRIQDFDCATSCNLSMLFANKSYTMSLYIKKNIMNGYLRYLLPCRRRFLDTASRSSSMALLQLIFLQLY
jgi:hypothetical protein